MLVICRFVSTLSLATEWVLGFPSVNLVFESLSAAVGFGPTVFFGWGVGWVYWSVRGLCPIGGI